jgi:hypothetical protein
MFSAISIAFAAVVRVLWSQNQKLHAQVAELQEKRVEEAKEVTEKVLEVKHEFDTLLDKQSAIVDAVIESRERRSR